MPGPTRHDGAVTGWIYNKHTVDRLDCETGTVRIANFSVAICTVNVNPCYNVHNSDVLVSVSLCRDMY